MLSGLGATPEAGRQAPARHEAERSIGDRLQKGIAAGPGILCDFGLQGNADASLGVICLMDGVVAPVSAVIIPEVMVGFGRLVVLHAPIRARGVRQPPS